MPIIFFGTRGISWTVDSGEFHCPRCSEKVPYKLKSTRPWFTVYFIPLFPVGGSERHVECRECGGAFREDVLEYRAPKDSSQDYAAELYEELEAGKSIETIRRKLERLGMSPTRSEEMIDEMTRGKVWSCPECGFHYLNRVKPCPKCTISK